MLIHEYIFLLVGDSG